MTFFHFVLGFALSFTVSKCLAFDTHHSDLRHSIKRERYAHTFYVRKPSSPVNRRRISVGINGSSTDDIDRCQSNSSKHRKRFCDRRNFILSSLLLQIIAPSSAGADIEGVVTPSFADPNPVASPTSLLDSELIPNVSINTSTSRDEVLLYTNKSGLKYIDLQKGAGPSPRYGQLCTISYNAYIKLPDSPSSNTGEKPQKYDSDNAYLIKHGNGRLIPGLDEGIHTMKVGGKRRLIIPPKLGYIGPGVLAPIPDTPLGRYQLNRLLEKMIERRGGNIVIDVELRAVIDDEADQGYYDDGSLTPEDFDILKTNLQQKAAAARNQSESNFST